MAFLANKLRLLWLTVSASIAVIVGTANGKGHALGHHVKSKHPVTVYLHTIKPGHHFHLTIPGNNGKLGRRDTTYITVDGYLTSDQTQASIFFINNNELYSDNVPVSADPTDPYIPFASSSEIKSITSTWSTTNGLNWFNQSFTVNDGVAGTCQDATNRVYLVLQESPTACDPVGAKAVPTPPANSMSPASTSTSISSFTSISSSLSTSTTSAAATTSSFTTSAAATTSSFTTSAAATTSSSTTSAAASSTTASFDPVNTPCPGANNQVYTDANGDNYEILCNHRDSGGSQVAETTTNTMSACIEACSDYNNENGLACYGIVFVPAGLQVGYDTCYLKSEDTTYYDNTGSDDPTEVANVPAILSSSLRIERDPRTLEELPEVQAMWDGMMKSIESAGHNLPSLPKHGLPRIQWSGIELRFPVLDAHGPESDAKISLASWASMI